MYKPPELPQLGHNRMTISAIKGDGLIYARTDTAGNANSLAGETFKDTEIHWWLLVLCCLQGVIWSS